MLRSCRGSDGCSKRAGCVANVHGGRSPLAAAGRWEVPVEKQERRESPQGLSVWVESGKPDEGLARTGSCFASALSSRPLTSLCSSVLVMIYEFSTYRFC